MVENAFSRAAELRPLPLAELRDEPLVSILVGNYNYERYIRQTIESVLRQSYAHWELVICDDGSTDDSVQIIRSYAERDARIRLLEKENGGHASALNTAFAACQGEIVCLLDSDDVYLPEKLAATVRAVRNNPEAGLLLDRIVRVDERGQRQGVWPLSDGLAEGWMGSDLLRSGGVFPDAPPTSGITLRREIARTLFPLSTTPPLDMCPDQVIMRLAPLVTAVKRVPEPLSEYRLHSGNSFSQRQITAESLKRQLRLGKALWEEQRRFLKGRDAGLAHELAPLEESPEMALLEFLRARLEGDSTARQRHLRYLEVSGRMGGSRLIWFWRKSLYVPRWLFGPAVNLLLGQNMLKQVVARLRKLA